MLLAQAARSRSPPLAPGPLPTQSTPQRACKGKGSEGISPAKTARSGVPAASSQSTPQPHRQPPKTKDASTNTHITPWSGLPWRATVLDVDAPGERQFAPGWYRRGAWEETWTRDDNVEYSAIVIGRAAARNATQIDAKDSELSIRVVDHPNDQVLPRGQRRLAIYDHDAEGRCIIKLIQCQHCREYKLFLQFSERVIRRVQFSFLHALDRRMIRRTHKTVWCRDCAAAAYRRGNMPDGYVFRIRATAEIMHQNRVTARLFALHDSNHLGERLALSPEVEFDLLRQLDRYWANPETSDGQSDMMGDDHVSSEDDPAFQHIFETNFAEPDP